MSIEVIRDIFQILGVEQHLVPIIEVVMAIINEVIKLIIEDNIYIIDNRGNLNL